MMKTITASAAALAVTLMAATGLQAAPEKTAEDAPAEQHRGMMSGASMGMMEQMSRMMESCNEMMEAKHGSPHDEESEPAPG